MGRLYRWTRFEDLELEKVYTKYGPIKAQEALPHRSLSAIRARVQSLGLRRECNTSLSHIHAEERLMRWYKRYLEENGGQVKVRV